MDYEDDHYREAWTLIYNLPGRLVSWWYVPDVADPRARTTWRDTARRLSDLGDLCEAENVFTLKVWAADAYVGAGELEQALAVYPTTHPALNKTRIKGGRLGLGHRLSILFELGRGPAAVDIIDLGGPALTPFGHENIEMIIGFVDLQISTPEADGKTPAEKMRIEWMREVHEESQGFSLFSGGPAEYYVKHPRSFFFRDAKAALSDCFELVRSVENVVREESGLPRVGEGWISETKLYREVVEAFQGEDVIHHASPDWLGQQHLDIYLPSLSVAVEYQGAQHDQPVDFFGGEEGFRATQERDRRKLNICRRHGVRIVFVREGYDLATVIQQILAASR